jgi:serine/threonine protein kinase
VRSRHLRHPHIITILGWAKQHSKFSILTNLVIGPSLFSALFVQASKLQFSLTNKFHIGAQISSALHYMHQARPKVLHRDLKSDNILVSVTYNKYPNSGIPLSVSNYFTDRCQDLSSLCC